MRNTTDTRAGMIGATPESCLNVVLVAEWGCSKVRTPTLTHSRLYFDNPSRIPHPHVSPRPPTYPARVHLPNAQNILQIFNDFQRTRNQRNTITRTHIQNVQQSEAPNQVQLNRTYFPRLHTKFENFLVSKQIYLLPLSLSC